MISHHSPSCLFWKRALSALKEHTPFSGPPRDSHSRVGMPLPFPSSSGRRSEHDAHCYSNWRLDPEIRHNIVVVARETTSLVCQPTKRRAHSGIDAVQGTVGLR